jgi:tetratricopeptide (TPR) repeat protein
MILSLRVFGQEQQNFVYYDSLTFTLYSRKEWKELVSIKNEALTNGYDYYYLRMRLGIAYYEMKKFRASVPYFEKSLAFNTDDTTALKYLYFAYLESGRNGDATLLAKKHKEKLGTISGADAKVISSVYTEGGYTTGVSTTLNPYNLMGSDGIYGEEDCFTSQAYYHFGIQMQPLPALRIYLGGSILEIGKQKHFSYTTLDEPGNTWIVTDYILPYNFRQNEFYIAAPYKPVSGLTITPAYHFMNGNYPMVNSSYTDNNYTFNKSDQPYNHYVISVSAAKELGNFTLGLMGSYAELTSTGMQLQTGVSVTWYPMGNLDLYTTSSITGFESGTDKRIIFDQLVGGKIAPRLWLEGSVTTGNLSLYNEKNAFVVYNLPENIVFRCSANLIFTLNSHIDLSLMYRYYTREYEYYNYSKNLYTGELFLNTNTMKYQNQSFFGGLKWKF